MHSGVSPAPSALEAAGGFWQRLAAAAASAVTSAQPPQRHLHTQQLPSLQQFRTSDCQGSSQPARSDGVCSATGQRRGFAKRATRAARSSGGARTADAAAPDSQEEGQAPRKPAAPAEPTDADMEAANRERCRLFVVCWPSLFLMVCKVSVWHLHKSCAWSRGNEPDIDHCMSMQCRLEWFADRSTAELVAADVGKFFDLTAARIPEGFQDFYASAAARGETFVLKGGCKGLQVRTSVFDSCPGQSTRLQAM